MKILLLVVLIFSLTSAHARNRGMAPRITLENPAVATPVGEIQSQWAAVLTPKLLASIPEFKALWASREAAEFDPTADVGDWLYLISPIAEALSADTDYAFGSATEEQTFRAILRNKSAIHGIVIDAAKTFSTRKESNEPAEMADAALWGDTFEAWKGFMKNPDTGQTVAPEVLKGLDDKRKLIASTRPDRFNSEIFLSRIGRAKSQTAIRNLSAELTQFAKGMTTFHRETENIVTLNFALAERGVALAPRFGFQDLPTPTRHYRDAAAVAKGNEAAENRFVFAALDNRMFLRLKYLPADASREVMWLAEASRFDSVKAAAISVLRREQKSLKKKSADWRAIQDIIPLLALKVPKSVFVRIPKAGPKIVIVSARGTRAFFSAVTASLLFGWLDAIPSSLAGMSVWLSTTRALAWLAPYYSIGINGLISLILVLSTVKLVVATIRLQEYPQKVNAWYATLYTKQPK